jgi:hypothetical protein
LIRPISVLVLALTTLVFGLPNATAQLISPAVKQQLNQREDQIDVGIAALTIAKEVFSDLDIPTYSHKLDTLADKVRVLARGTRDPEQRIRALNTVLFRDEGFHYDRAVFARSNRTYYYLNGILDTKKGICYTMPLLYVSVAQRLGYPIYPVAVPDHLFARYVDSSFKEQNIETTSGGKYFTDAEYFKDFSVGARGRSSGGYLRTMTYHEFLAHILVASAFGLRGDGNKVLAYLEQAVALNPGFPDFYDSLGEGYLAKSNVVKPDLAELYREKASWYISRAKQLGFVGLEQIAAGRKTRGQ